MPPKRTMLIAGVLAAAGVAIGVLVLPATPKPPDAKTAPPTVTLAGERVELAGDKVIDHALEIVRKYAAGSLTLKLPGGERREVSRAALGAEIDKAYLSQLMLAARDPTSPMRRAHAARSPTATLALPIAVRLDAARAEVALLALKEELDRAPSDARLDLASRKLVPETLGYRLDVYATMALLDEALFKGRAEVEAAGEAIAPAVHAKDLGNVTFDEVLGWFETRYSADKKHEARTYNLRIAASKLDGHILVPGATFDFNKVVGPRNEAAGYKVAPVIAQGELVDGIGGGTCQITGTLHGAVFFAGLEVVNRTPHTRPSGYIKMGLDAAVAYPTINFRFKNNLPYPVVLHETVKDGVVRAEVLGPKRKRAVTFIRKIDEIIPFQEQEKPDPKLPDGVKVLAQRGIPGFKLHRYRIVREGIFGTRERWADTYPPTTQIIRVGTGQDKDTPVPADDAHLEYTADELLTMTQGMTPGAGTERDLTESREPGRSGSAGWMEKLGMPVWDAKRRGGDERDDDKKRDKRDADDKKRDDDRKHDKRDADDKKRDEPKKRRKKP
ncbi:MAG: VanW family protein [Polyangiaceae bacterium]|nr:VanW family protein [Polyangiaceae bacterium]